MMEAANDGGHAAAAALLALVERELEEGHAENVIVIDLAGKSTMADFMVVASGRSQRHIGALAERLIEAIKREGHGRPAVEGLTRCDWVLIDAGDVIVHVFRPEVRAFYNLEKMWAVALPEGEEAPRAERRRRGPSDRDAAVGG